MPSYELVNLVEKSMKEHNRPVTVDEVIKEYGRPSNYKDLYEKEGYFVYYYSKKGIQVKKGRFLYRLYYKHNVITTTFYHDNSKNYMLLHDNIEPLKIYKQGRVMVENKEDIDKAISMVKDYLRKRVSILRKEYDETINNFEKAIENEVKYEC